MLNLFWRSLDADGTVWRLRWKPCSSPVDDDRSGDEICPVGSGNGPSLQHVCRRHVKNMLRGRAIFVAHRPVRVAGPVVVDGGGAGLFGEAAERPRRTTCRQTRRSSTPWCRRNLIGSLFFALLCVVLARLRAEIESALLFLLSNISEPRQ